VMSPKSVCGMAYQSSSPGGYTKGEHGGTVLCRQVAYGLPPPAAMPIASVVARSTSLPSSKGSRRRRSDAATRTARYDVSPAASDEAPASGGRPERNCGQVLRREGFERKKLYVTGNRGHHEPGEILKDRSRPDLPEGAGVAFVCTRERFQIGGPLSLVDDRR